MARARQTEQGLDMPCHATPRRSQLGMPGSFSQNAIHSSGSKRSLYACAVQKSLAGHGALRLRYRPAFNPRQACAGHVSSVCSRCSCSYTHMYSLPIVQRALREPARCSTTSVSNKPQCNNSPAWLSAATETQPQFSQGVCCLPAF